MTPGTTMSVPVGASQLAAPRGFVWTASRRISTRNSHRQERRCARVTCVDVVARGSVAPKQAVDRSGGADDDVPKRTSPPLQFKLASSLAAATIACTSPAFANEAWFGVETVPTPSSEVWESISVDPVSFENDENDEAEASKTQLQVLPSDPSRVPTTKGEVILDYGNVFAKFPEDKSKLVSAIQDVERKTGWRVRVVTSFGPGGSGIATPPLNDLYRYFGTTDRQLVVITADELKGNVLELYNDQVLFNELVPKSVVQEIRGRFGNKYFVDEEGMAQSVYQATQIITTCLATDDGCKFVPGLSQQQREFSLVAVVTGGFLFGAASRSATQDSDTASPWLVVFGFIWVPWVLGFGFYPLYVRQPEDLSPLVENAALFLLCVFATRLGTGVFGNPDGDGDAGGPKSGGSE